MAQTSPTELLALAKTQLSLSPSASASAVPHAYLEELRNHLNLYPHDTLFRVTLEPKKGLGSVTCLEEGCDHVPIPLVKRVKANDGGLRVGLGSLSAYRVHIEGHATHKQRRLARLRSGGRAESTVALPVKKEESAADSPFGTPQRQPFGSQGISVPSSSAKPSIPKRSSLVRVTPRAGIKPEVVEPTIPRKRGNDVAFGIKAENDALVKKPKQEQLNKVPLAQVDRNTIVAKKEPVPFALVDRNAVVTKKESVPAPLTVDVDAIRAKINETQSLISHPQVLHDRILRKRKKEQGRKPRDSRGTPPSWFDSAAQCAVRRVASQSIVAPFGGAKPKAEPFASPFIASERQQARRAANDQRHRVGVQGPRAARAPADGRRDEVDPVLTLNKYLHAIPDIAPLGGLDHADDNGDYHGAAATRSWARRPRRDDIDKFLIQAGNAEQFDGDASIEKALEKLGLQTTHELLPSLDIPLMPHQLLGVAWMVEKEKTKTLKGGCMADEMGLGKTVQMIATMCKNPSEDPACKTTLILAPLALLVLIYHGSNKVKRKADLLKYDVVLTTYSTMALEWPDYEADMKKKEKAKSKKPANDFIASDSDDSGSDRPKNKRKKERGLLFQVDFYRIVLDEAQNIRNKRTRPGFSCVTELSSQHRWCLTATPIINSLVDVYGYLRFLRVRPWYDWTVRLLSASFSTFAEAKIDRRSSTAMWGRLEKKQPQQAVARLQAILGLFLLRRMKTTMLDGKRLIELPERSVELRSLTFSQEERDIYAMVETRQQEKFNRYLRAGTENGSHFLAADEVDDPEEYRDELSRARAVMSPEFVKKMKEKFKDAALRRMEAEKESPDAVMDQDDCPICFDALTAAVVTPCGHQFCKDCLTDVLQTPLPEGADPKYKANERPCPACRSAISSDKLFSSAAFEPSDKDLAGDADEHSDIEMEDVKPVKSAPKGKGKAKRPARRSAARKFVVLDSSDAEVDEEEPASDDDDYKDSDLSDFIVESGEDEEEKDVRRNMKKRLGKRRAITTILDSDEEMDDVTPEETEILFGARKKLSKEDIKLMPKFLPSTKMKAMMDVLKQLAEEKPDEKTLVISQWTACLDIVSDYLTEAGIVHVKYQGDMNRNKRDQAVQVFMSKDKARVMLMSLKCGGVGLNLTRANNVISLDLGWSPAIDFQAFDRVHRLGQNRKVIVNRLVIADTGKFEDRILALQERKQNLADGSLGEGKGKKIGRLSVRELANLFGLNARGRVLAKD
ncbi:P-loop containing nucleoside triphosphate hydrolase protein [Mycena galericulata]|nr:P-loop containing nucleoside triphosphate hydrolase protein [Mycena galericulata]